MKIVKNVLKLIVVGCIAQSSIVFFNVKANTITRFTSSQYQAQVTNQNHTSGYYIPTLEPRENKKQLFDNERKVFDKDINVPKNRIEYENLKDFLIEKKEAITRFDKIKFTNLSKTTILTYRKQLESTKSLEGIIQFEKIIKTARDNDANEFYFKLAEYGYLIVGTIFGWLLFKFYTKKFIYRMKYVEEIPDNEDDLQVQNDEFLKNQNIVTQTQVLPIVDFEEASIAQTLTFAQQDFIEEQELELEEKLSRSSKNQINNEDTWIFSEISKGDKK